MTIVSLSVFNYLSLYLTNYLSNWSVIDWPLFFLVVVANWHNFIYRDSSLAAALIHIHTSQQHNNTSINQSMWKMDKWNQFGLYDSTISSKVIRKYKVDVQCTYYRANIDDGIALHWIEYILYLFVCLFVANGDLSLSGKWAKRKCVSVTHLYIHIYIYVYWNIHWLS